MRVIDLRTLLAAGLVGSAVAVIAVLSGASAAVFYLSLPAVAIVIALGAGRESLAPAPPQTSEKRQEQRPADHPAATHSH